MKKHSKNYKVGIINAIEDSTNLLLLGCHRHLRNDIKRWVEEHGGGVDQKREYVSDIQDLMMADKYHDYTRLYNELNVHWSNDFRDYFDSSPLQRLDRYAKWAIGKKCPFDPDEGITNNICEGFNYLHKNLQSWRSPH